ncbi:hypothetical protein J7E36_00325 [Pseudomonas fluorescens]|nr:hypothetical protein [Pseudomonas fluorescens]
MTDGRFTGLKHPTLLTGHVGHGLSLIDVHHSHRRGRFRDAADSAEMGLWGAMNRHLWRLGLLALLPKKQLLTSDESDQQRQNSPQALLDVQGSQSKRGGTLTIHPEIPPTGVVVIWLRRCERRVDQTIAVAVPEF